MEKHTQKPGETICCAGPLARLVEETPRIVACVEQTLDLDAQVSILGAFTIEECATVSVRQSPRPFEDLLELAEASVMCHVEEARG